MHFRREVLESVAAGLPPDVRDEMAIPSYLHRNPAIHWLIARRMSVVLRLMSLQRGESLLDFGCGVGMLPLQIEPGLARIYATDLDLAPAQAFLQAHGRDDVMLIGATALEAGIADHSLDCAIALEVLEHVDDVGATAAMLGRKLRRDGRLVVCGPTENTLYALGRRVAGFSGAYHHRDVYDFMRDVEKQGFVATRRARIPLPRPFTLFVATRYERTALEEPPDSK